MYQILKLLGPNSRFWPKIALNKIMKWQFLTNLGAKIQMHFEFFTTKNNQFWHKNRNWPFFEAFQQFVVFGQKMDLWHTVRSRAFLAMLDCAGGRFVRFSGFGFLPLYSFSENLACGYANWSIYPTFHGRKAYRRETRFLHYGFSFLFFLGTWISSVFIYIF